MFIFGFQEIIDLNTKNVIVDSSDSEKMSKLWLEGIRETINKIDNYIVIEEKFLVGVYLIVFIKDKLKSKISKVNTDLVKCGIMNKLGNKVKN